ncbi:MAG TPA: BBP7 family outer membrane beta-barrel protein [Pirellulales bacterium]|nr:BBP7 family outer membrane beta-barrel protein [Pirellulales bacterium]
MSINRSKLWLALGLPLLFASMAWGQELPDNEWVPGVRDFQAFAPASSTTSPYGSGPKRSRGWFFTIEDLAWSTSAPERTTIGDANFTPLVSYDGQGYFQQQNSLDTAFIQPSLRQGERLQLGYVGEDGKGWMVGTFVVHSQTSTAANSNAGVSFFSPNIPGVPGTETEGFIDNYTNSASITGNQPIVLDTDVNHNNVFGGDGRGIIQNIGGVPTLVGIVPAPVDWGDLIQLPIYFQQVVTKYSSNIWGIEVMRTWWLSKSRRADHGYWDVMAGVRYIRFRDQFYFSGQNYTNTGITLNATTPVVTVTGPIQEVGGLLGNTFFNQNAANYLVGPQVGLRWTKQRGRLGFNAEGRFAGAANFQTIQQTGQINDLQNNHSLNTTMVRVPIENNLVNTAHAAATGALPALLYDTPFLQSTAVHHTQHSTQFSPIGELRLNMTYQIFRNVQATVGWTGLVMGGIARSSSTVSYTLPDMGILNSGNRQVLFVQGLNFGININR